MPYRNKRVLVTGGLGFIGSNLTIRLVEAGAKVTIVDSSVAGCGANLHNIEPVRREVEIIPLGICEAARFREAIESSEIVFNLAGEISHVHSMQFPERDLQLNGVAQLQFLLACAKHAPGIRVVYASTRQVYGVPDYLPTDELHPIHPVDFNGIHKYIATSYHLLLSQLGQLDAVALRLTNIYGPRMALNIPCQGFLSTFLRRVLLGYDIEVFGDGNQLRDPVYVDEAVEAFLLAGKAPTLASRVYNVGGGQALRLSEIAETLVRAAGGQVVYRPFPEDRKAIDIGSYYTDSTRINEHLGWKPQIRFEEGILRTLEYYRRELPHYLNPAEPYPACTMPEHSGEIRRLTFATVCPGGNP
jgi:UDP-glucose 4-epimerase